MYKNNKPNVVRVGVSNLYTLYMECIHILLKSIIYLNSNIIYKIVQNYLVFSPLYNILLLSIIKYYHLVKTKGIYFFYRKLDFLFFIKCVFYILYPPDYQEKKLM